MKLKWDISYRPRVISFGIDIGNNSLYMKKMNNFFIDISILFWTFGLEFEW